MPHQDRLTLKHSVFAAGSILSLAIVLSLNTAQSDSVNSPYSNSNTDPVQFSNPNSSSNPNTSSANAYPGPDIYRSSQSAAVRASPTPNPTLTGSPNSAATRLQGPAVDRAGQMNGGTPGQVINSEGRQNSQGQNNQGQNTQGQNAQGQNFGTNQGTNLRPNPGTNSGGIQNPAPGTNPNTPNSLQTRPNSPSQPAGTVQ